jgi:Ca2+-binding RTX toxin-like protein
MKGRPAGVLRGAAIAVHVIASVAVSRTASAEVTCDYRRADATVVVHLERLHGAWMRLAGSSGEIRMYRPLERIDCGAATVANTRRIVVHGGASGASFGVDNAGTGGAFPSSISFDVLEAAAVSIRGTDGHDIYVVHPHRIDTGRAEVRLPPSVQLSISGGGGDDRIDARAKARTFMSARGGPGDDRIVGGPGPDGLEGGRGTDILVSARHDRSDIATDSLWGEAGDDRLIGGAGADVMEGGPGSDVMQGGPGKDSATWAHELSGVMADVAGGTVISGTDVDTIASIEEFMLTTYDDEFTGGPNGEVVRAWFGNDVISGSAGGDRLIGGEGDDTLAGGSGEDRLRGNGGTDSADGGDDVDVCAAETVVNCES